jgi:glycogen debranching enzyme
LLLLLGAEAWAQTKTEDLPLMFSTSDAGSSRFVAAHGERALLMGYSGSGLEAWAYPFQLFRNYRIQFLPRGAAAVNGPAILRRTEYHPEEIVRTYVGPGFEVREHLFVPRDRPGVALTYDVTGRRTIKIKVTLLPVLDLMWPGAIGGQDLNWVPSLQGYVISERTTGMRAILASPQEIDHTGVVNATHRQDLTQSMVLRPSRGRAQVFAVLEKSAQPHGEELRSVEDNFDALRTEAHAHSQTVLESGIQINTPNAALNRAFAWSKIALDQAWVCNDPIGCGEVGGYGPSRPERRPQYAWFFAGDGLVATEGLLADGDTARAQQELAFIFHYQNPENGMIWHEISQSANYVDWSGKYPYMYVHVDITFQFLATLADDYEGTGDLDFIRAHWGGIKRAWDYCRSLIDPATALPQIPAGKEGGNEQDRMREDAGLSAAWAAASDAYRRLALALGETSEAEAAARAHDAAQTALAGRYWNPQKQFWIAGFAEDGHAMTDERSHSGLLGYGVLPPAQEDVALDRLASAHFETDWGTRSMSDASPNYKPDSYGAGSVFELNTADTAEAFWRDHRPAIAWPVWASMLPALQLDSLGHVPEVLAGDVFHPQVESVPEQTWSSAGLLHSLSRGVFGLEIDAPAHRLTLAPHLNPRWGQVALRQLAVGATRVDVTIAQKPGEIDADFFAQGAPVHLRFAPQIPLGATNISASLDGRPISVAVEQHAEDEHAGTEIELPPGTLHCSIVYDGGARVFVPEGHPIPGAASHALKLTSLRLVGHRLMVDADVAAPEDASIELETPWKIQSVQGGRIADQHGLWSTLTLANASARRGTYVHTTMTVEFSPR